MRGGPIADITLFGSPICVSRKVDRTIVFILEWTTKHVPVRGPGESLHELGNACGT